VFNRTSVPVWRSSATRRIDRRIDATMVVPLAK
jgi:hypothetical protein